MNDLVIPVEQVRAAGAAWAAMPMGARLAVVRRARRALARGAEALATTVARPAADTIVAEVLPLLEAMRFLERRGERVLRARAAAGRRPLWLLGVRSRIRRDPLGAVLVLGPGNYPIFLPGVQAMQALVAGNGVAWKPAPGGEEAAAFVRDALVAAGLPAAALAVLGARDGAAAVAAGFDHVVLTGSAATGAAVLAAAAAGLVPCTMELSGSDPVFVLPGADLGLVARSLAYGLRLNGGATCIAPRRVFVAAADAAALEARLVPLLAGVPDAVVPEAVAARLAEFAGAAGARVSGRLPRPVVLADVPSDAAILGEDIFAPWLALVPVADMDAARAANARCRYRLGASVFGPSGAARAFAATIGAGAICINDLIVPTADPRLPFGGGGRSGFGRTRGAEGLLAMTAAVTVSERRGWFRPHLAPPQAGDAGRFARLVWWLHG